VAGAESGQDHRRAIVDKTLLRRLACANVETPRRPRRVIRWRRTPSVRPSYKGCWNAPRSFACPSSSRASILRHCGTSGIATGVSVVAVRTPALTQEQLVKVLTYRLVQYLLADQLDPQLIFEEGLKHEPLSNVSSGDVHVLAGTSSGEMLCYFTIESLAASRGGTTLRTVDTAGVVTAVLPVILLVVLLVVRLDPGNWVGAWGGPRPAGG
jgi:hypothetical protein